jgi:uncharacterized protein YbjT (DUF2867 family)
VSTSEAGKTFVVVGATGAVGQVVTETLREGGYRVRAVSRKAGVAIDDSAGLASAFAGADGGFLMVPFDQSAPSIHERETDLAGRLALAVTNARLRRVVLLSGTSAHLKHRAGSGTGAAIMEALLDQLDIPELVHLRACFFMENHLNFGLPDQAKNGMYATMFRPDLPTPMIAAADVGRAAAELLARQQLTPPRIRELLGPRDYTMTEATHILGAAIGKPELRYQQLSYNDGARAMLQTGLSRSFVDAVVTTARSFNEETVWATEQRSALNTTPTTLETFAHTVFRPAYQAA